MGHAAEVTRWNLCELKGKPKKATTVDAVVKIQSKPPARQANQSYGNPCQYCGGRRQRGNCPAYGKTCTQGNKRNHFATVCRGKPKSEVNEVVEEEPVNVGGFDLFVGMISANKPDAWYETLTVFNLSVKFKLDPEPTSLPAVCSKTLIRLRLSVQRGRDVSNDVFEDLGISNGKQHKIHVDISVIPIIHPPRKVPFPILNSLREELSRLDQLKDIQKVDHSTVWVNSLTIIEKPNGKLRLCLDPKDLNKTIKRHHFEMPTSETVFAKMSGATVFSKLDASNGYWQIAVDPECSDLLTFNTPF